MILRSIRLTQPRSWHALSLKIPAAAAPYRVAAVWIPERRCGFETTAARLPTLVPVRLAARGASGALHIRRLSYACKRRSTSCDQIRHDRTDDWRFGDTFCRCSHIAQLKSAPATSQRLTQRTDCNGVRTQLAEKRWELRGRRSGGRGLACEDVLWPHLSRAQLDVCVDLKGHARLVH